MNASPHTHEDPNNDSGTLGALLYADKSKARISEREWVDLVRAVADRDQLALHALYERSHRLVFTLIMRIVASRESAEELTLDVFHDVWRRAADYDPAGGTVLGWILNQARSRAIDRVRFEHRKKRVDAGSDESPVASHANEHEERIALEERGRVLQQALQVLSADERTAIETAYFADLTYAEAAQRLDQPVGTVKTRIRSALSKLRGALGAEVGQS